MRNRVPPRGGVPSLTFEQVERKYPDAFLDTRSPYATEPYNFPGALDRLHAAGVGLVDILQDGSITRGYYRCRFTKQIQILDVISGGQQSGLLIGIEFETASGDITNSPLDCAIRAIAVGEFDDTFGDFYHHFSDIAEDSSGTGQQG